MPSVAELFIILEQYKYWVIFPLAIVEGPILSIICGFLFNLKIINPYVAFVLLVLGDLISGSFYYWVGRVWRGSSFIKKYGHYVGYQEENALLIEQQFHKHAWKTLLLAKFAYGMSGTVQGIAGVANISFYKFLWINTIGDIPKIAGLMFVGYYVGGSYIKIKDYLDSIATFFITLLVLLVLYFVLQKYLARYFYNKKEVDKI